jgi:RNA polymerase sigma factor (sigma-70 family)
VPRTNYRETVQDGEIVAAIVAGEPSGLAAAYDNYAPALYAYCRMLLGEPADAAEAVQDTFVVATAKLGGLSEPDQLRPWLYAVARNECFRRLRARGLSAPPDAAVELTSDEAGLTLGPDQQELGYLVVEALSGLSPGDREVIELSLRHVLDSVDLADALGVSLKHALALAARARTEFEQSLGALLVAQTGRSECTELDDMLASWDGVGWDGELTPLLRQSLNQHIRRCEICGERKRNELSPAMLLSLLPMVALPEGLREQVLGPAGDDSPAGAGHREQVARRAEPFGKAGFPKPIVAPRRVYGRQGLAVAAGAAVAAAVLLGVGTVAVLDALHHKGPAAASAATLGPHAVNRAPLNSVPDPVLPSPASHKGSGKHIRLTITVSGSPSPPGTSPTGSQPGGPTPGHSRSPSPTPSPPPSSPGTLVASTGTVTLTLNTDGSLSGSFTLTAEGGDVSSWSIQNPAPAGTLSVSPSSGSLTSGQSVTISLSAPSAAGLASETDLTVSPGGLTVAVDLPA